MSAPKSMNALDLRAEALKNTYYRRILVTTGQQQLGVMRIPPLGEVGLETHDDVGQILRVEEGVALAIVGGEEQNLSSGSVIVVPLGIPHNVINLSAEQDLKLSTIYSPPHHPPGTLQKDGPYSAKTKKVSMTKSRSRSKVRRN